DDVVELSHGVRKKTQDQIENGIPNVVAVAEGLGLSPAAHSEMALSVGSMHVEPQPRLHRLELGRRRFTIFEQRLPLVSKMHELFGAQRRSIVAPTGPRGDIDPS